MVTSAGTQPTDVENELDTDLLAEDIAPVLQRVERDIDREYSNPGFDDTQHRVDFEAALAALRIATGAVPDAQDRTASDVRAGAGAVTYEASVVKSLRQRVRRRDPQNTFGHPGSVIRDTGRHITSTTDS